MNFRSYAHKIYTIRCKRTSIHSFDDKRYLLDNNVQTLPYGHYKIAELACPNQLGNIRLRKLRGNMADASIIKKMQVN